MDLNYELCMLNSVPGLDVSKGERIVKALQKLQTKIKFLKYAGVSKKETSTKEVFPNNDEDLTITDVKFKLLVLQLQYIKALLKKNNTDKTPYLHDVLNVQLENQEIKFYCKETQTGQSLCEPNIQTDFKSNIKSAKHTIDSTPVMDNEDVPRYNTLATKSLTTHKQTLSEKIYVSTITKEPISHYCLKFDDVPFILGASSTASHNVVANVQNIIAMMKNHNKVLCGSRYQGCKNNISQNPAETSSYDTNKIMTNLSSGLTESQMRKAKPIEKVNTTQDTTSVNEITHKIAFSQGNKKEMCKIPTNRAQSNLTQLSRQRILSSLKDFKVQLSEEDISWD